MVERVQTAVCTVFRQANPNIWQPHKYQYKRHEQLKSAFHSKFDSYTDNLFVTSCTVELVDECVRNLKRGKAAGHDDLTAEHVQNSHPLLMVLLSLLFNMIIVHGMVPDDFGKCIIIPLIKNNEGNKTSSDNYRGITLSPVLSKLFEMILLNDLQNFLESDSLQFGFKKKSSCSHAILALRSVVEHYCKSGSTVTVCALDISKAYDRVDQYALLSLLMERNAPKYFVNIMHSWFEKGCTDVSSSSSSSSKW